MKRCLIVIYFLVNCVFSQGAWMISGRTHPELIWKTYKTENFNIHYHKSIKNIAYKGAYIAESVRESLMNQLNIENISTIDIIFTSEDEIMNGFALPSNTTIIWVDQNDAALWSDGEKWLKTVLVHELQHIVYFNSVKSWLPSPMSNLYSGTPTWFIEGVAEYFTEDWRPSRFDISHKYHNLKNSLKKIKDPHNHGFSKVLYLASKYGDETLVNIIKYRDKLKLFNFNESFESYTNTTIEKFEEDWRKILNTYYYGQRSQKEAYTDIGLIKQLPIKDVMGFDYFPNPNKLALIGKKNSKQLDISVLIATRDILKEEKVYKKQIEEEKNNLKFIRKKKYWDVIEIDYGKISSVIDVSNDGTKITYAKYGYGKDQSLIWDVYVYDIFKKRKIKITNSERANNPCWSPDNKTIAFVKHKNSTSNLYKVNIDSLDYQTRITNYSGDIQIMTPSWSPDGLKIAYAISKEDGNVDINIFDLPKKEPIRITYEENVDYLPIWHLNADKISYTSQKDMTPNIFTYDIIEKKIVQNTNIGDAIWTGKWNPSNNFITGITLPDSDSSRVIDVDPNRQALIPEININEVYSAWKNKKPLISIPKLDYSSVIIDSSENENYIFYKHLKNQATIFFPDLTGLFYSGLISDATGRHILSSTIFTDYKDFSYAISYQNATGKIFKGFWGIEFFNDIFFNLRAYDRNSNNLIEVYNGFRIYRNQNINFGHDISSNHNLKFRLGIFDREVSDAPHDKEIFSSPISGKEGSLEVIYLFKSQRANRQNLFTPYQGRGFKIGFKNVNKNIWGDFSYNRIDVDAFYHKKILFTALFLRMRFESLQGNPPPQEAVGLVNSPNQYILGQLVLGKENMSPRGWSGISILGEKAFFGTVELRTQPVMIDLISIFKFISLGNFTAAIISDFGKVSNVNKNLWVSTAGIEIKAAISVSGMPLIFYSFGWAQDSEKWSKDNYTLPDPYFRLALISPF